MPNKWVVSGGRIGSRRDGESDAMDDCPGILSASALTLPRRKLVTADCQASTKGQQKEGPASHPATSARRGEWEPTPWAGKMMV